MRAILAIGLNVRGAEPAGQLNDTLFALNKWSPARKRIVAGEWEGVSERTLQVEVQQWVGSDAVADLCAVLRQDAIAVYMRGERWILVFRDGSLSAGGTLAEYPINLPE